jgi:hypothetical protein
MQTENDTSKPEDSPEQVTGEGCSGATCSAFILAKKCPDGRVINLQFPDELELQDHLMAMWQFTTGYEIVAVFRVPNDESIHHHRHNTKQP